MLIEVVHGGLDLGATRGFVALSRLEVSYDANEFDGVACGQARGLQVKLIEIGVARLGTQSDVLA